jgi:CRISPR system Cascade subunit CasB
MAEGKKTFSENFIEHILSGLGVNRRMGACLRRADNPATEYQSWEYLAPLGLFPPDASLARIRRRVFTLIAAALARAKPAQDGVYGLGKSLRGVYAESDSKQAIARLRRLLACSSLEETCDVLRPTLRLIADKSRYPISYAGLMTDLLYYEERVREQWAREFFATDLDDKKEDKHDALTSPADA